MAKNYDFVLQHSSFIFFAYCLSVNSFITSLGDKKIPAHNDYMGRNLCLPKH